MKCRINNKFVGLLVYFMNVCYEEKQVRFIAWTGTKKC